METVTNFIKEHKLLSVLIAILIAFIIIFIILYNMLFVYGDDNRLNGKKEVEISEKSQNELADTIKKYDNVEDVKINVVTKEVSILLYVKEGTEKDMAKELSDKILEEFSDSEKEYYDIQTIVLCKKCDAKDETYPLIGYKNKKKDKFTWGNN